MSNFHRRRSPPRRFCPRLGSRVTGRDRTELMGRDLGAVGRRAVLLGLLGSVLLVAGCGGGGGDGAGSSDTLAAAANQPSSQTADSPPSARGGNGRASKGTGNGGSPRKAQTRESGGAARPTAPTAKVSEPQPDTAVPAEQGPGPSRGGHGGHKGSPGGKPKGGVKGQGAGNSGHVVVPSPTETSGDPYTVARQLCGDQSNLDLVPPEYRSNVDYLAQMYAQIFDPEHQEAAQAGCLAGLHDLGL